MSKRRIYYQHLHFKGSKQGPSWETQFHETPTIQSLGQKTIRARMHAPAVHVHLHAFYTHTHMDAHTSQSLPFPCSLSFILSVI